MKTTFEKLSIGDKFEFATKTNIGGGMFNGIGIKTSSHVYSMAGRRIEIGDVKTPVVTCKSQGKSTRPHSEHAALVALESACRNFPPSLLVPLAVQSALAQLDAVRGNGGKS